MDDPEQFIGCILSIKTKQKLDGGAEAIIGTVRSIDLASQTITLDDTMCNGAILDDGFVLQSSTIADLVICGKAGQESTFYAEAPYSPVPDNYVQPLPKAEESTPPPMKPKNSDNKYKNVQKPENGSYDNLGYCRHPPENGSKTFLEKSVVKPESQAVKSKTSSSAFVKASTTNKEQPSPKNFYALNPLCGGANGQDTPAETSPNSKLNNTAAIPTTVDPKVVYTASELERDYFAKAKARRNSGGINSNTTEKRSVPQKTFIVNHRAGVGDQVQEQIPPPGILNGIKQLSINSGSKKSQQKPNFDASTVDDPFFKLFGPHQVKQAQPVVVPKNKAGAQAQSNARSTVVNNFQFNQNSRSPRGKQPQQTKQQLDQYGRTFPATTFEMTNAEIKSEEFDFEENLAMFEKLPTAGGKPTKLQKNPHFCPADTTYLAERSIDSIKLKGMKPEKLFVTDTGIIIPGVKLSTRNTILNSVHHYGLSHGRMVEVMGRAVAQACVPMLGDAYRLSPERVDDRPKVLVCTGPHWQGAAGICAARILASQGIITYVHAWKEELTLCATEERLYGLTGQVLTRDVKDLKGVNFDMVILAMNDHLENQLTVGSFVRWMKGKTVVLIDPPLLPSYRQAFSEAGISQANNAVPCRLLVICPTLPLAYPADLSVKLFLVNMGIPVKVFEESNVVYKSPFGDKLILQIFSTKQDYILNNASA